MDKHISILVGSLRRGSYARKIALNVLNYFPEGYTASIVEIRDLPLYDFDYDDPDVVDKPTPSQYTEFRRTIKNSQGVLFVTPENNRTIPACLKNAVDICSKPNGDVAMKGLPRVSSVIRWVAWAATAPIRISGWRCRTSICHYLASQRFSWGSRRRCSTRTATLKKSPPSSSLNPISRDLWSLWTSV